MQALLSTGTDNDLPRPPKSQVGSDYSGVELLVLSAFNTSRWTDDQCPMLGVIVVNRNYQISCQVNTIGQHKCSS